MNTDWRFEPNFDGSAYGTLYDDQGVAVAFGVEREAAERILALQEQIAAAVEMRSALEAIIKALCDTKDETYWPARDFLSKYDIFHDDLTEERVLLAVAQTALQIASSERPVRQQIVGQLEEDFDKRAREYEEAS